MKSDGTDFNNLQMAHIRNTFNYVATPDTILRALFRFCNKCFGANLCHFTKIPTDLLPALSEAVSVSNYPESHVSSQVDCLVNAIVGMMFKPGQYTIVQCGSTAVGLKKCDWGEFDFQLQLHACGISSE